MEIWKKLDGCSYYEVSSNGRVWSHISKRYLATPLNKAGYPHFCINPPGGKQQTKIVSNEMGKAFLKREENQNQVRHKNGIRNDNRLENLEWGTPKDNADDRRTNEYLGKKLLTPNQIVEIEKRISIGHKAKDIAKDMGVHEGTIYMNTDKRWNLTKREMMYECIKRGAKVVLVAEYFGVSYQSVVACMINNYEPVKEIRKTHPINKSMSLDSIYHIVKGLQKSKE